MGKRVSTVALFYKLTFINFMTFLEMKYLDNLKGINDYFNLACEKYSNDEINKTTIKPLKQR